MSAVVPAASFKERLAQKRRDLLAKSTFELSVPGYDGLYVRYRVIGYDDVRTIGLQNEEESTSVSEGEINTAADILGHACEGLLEKVGSDDEGRPVYNELGYLWSGEAARDLFEVENLPEGVMARTALKMIFPYPHDMLMMTHFQEYMTQAEIGLGEVDANVLGESRAASAAIPSDSR